MMKGRIGLIATVLSARRIARKLGYVTDALVIGGFSLMSAQILRGALNTNQTLIVDDGTSTIKELDANDLEDGFQPHFVSRWKEGRTLRAKIWRLVAGLNLSNFSQPIKIVTAFSPLIDRYPNVCIYHHNFESLRKQMPQKTIDRNTVLYFGSQLSEKNFLSLGQEIRFLQTIAAYYTNERLRFIYVAHRFDSFEKIRMLESRAIDVKYLGEPAELYFANSSTIPCRIASSISTVLNTVRLIHPEIQADIFPIDAIVRPEKRENIETLTTYFQKTGVRTVALDSSSPDSG